MASLLILVPTLTTFSRRFAGVNASNQSTRLMLGATEASLAEFKYGFTFYIEFHLASDGIRIDVEVVNNSAEEEMPFTAALHTYFTVGDVSQVGVAGVAGCTYLNNLGEREPVEGTEDPIIFAGEVCSRLCPAPPAGSTRSLAPSPAVSPRTRPSRGAG